MATLTIRKLSDDLIMKLKELARRNNRSMEQEVRSILEEITADRISMLKQIEAAWKTQRKRPSAEEINNWIHESRP